MGKTIKRILEDKLFDLELELHIKKNNLHHYDDDERELIYQRIQELENNIQEMLVTLRSLFSLMNKCK